MPATLAILAALPREIAALVRGKTPHAAFRHRGIFVYEIPGALVIAAGIGAHRATLALEAARSLAPLQQVISTGLAGSCAPQLGAGHVAEAALIIDARTGERFIADAHAPLDPAHTLVTSNDIAGIAEKSRLAEAYNAALVDMEAATLARLARAHGLRFRAIKAVSDGHDFELPSLAQFSDHQGHFRAGAFAMHTALRPGQWKRAAQLGRDSGRALRELTAVLQHEIDRAR